jgi:hypothetical protein
MKKTTILFTSILLLFIVACTGSDKYRGIWKAVDLTGKKFEIVFDAKSFTVTDTTRSKSSFEYSQNSVSINNSAITYGIKLGDGRAYQILFPNRDDQSTGLLNDENGNPVFTISRSGYVNYEDRYKLK